ncbi:MAG TPA: CBS domain-containing protein [Byssovorax sp.]|jgi:CBS domain-containing protein
MSLERFSHGAVCAELTDTAASVARRMRDFRVGSVVVTRGARPVGIVTDRDLVLRVIAEGRDAHLTLVSEIVTYEPTTLPDTASLEAAARTMRDHGVRRVPIVTDDGRIVGMVTADDLVSLLSRELADVGAGISEGVEATESR